MVTVVCADRACGIQYGIPEHVFMQAKEYGPGRPVMCPNGHTWHFTKAHADVDMWKARSERAENDAADYRKRWEQSVRRMNSLCGVITRLRARKVRP